MLRDRQGIDKDKDPPAQAKQAEPNRRAAPGKMRVASEDLFQKLRELVIVHKDMEYTLRITENDKLILTK